MLAEQLTDPSNARVIYLVAGGLALLALLIAIGTVLWWRTTEVEHPALGPLEVMGTRRWWKGDYAARRRHLDAARPSSADADGSDPAPEPVDLNAIASATPTPFHDLLDDFNLEALASGSTPAPVTAAEAAAAAVVVEPVDLSDPAIGDGAVPTASPEDPTAAVAAPTAAVVASTAAVAAPTAAAAAPSPSAAPMDPLLRLNSDE